MKAFVLAGIVALGIVAPAAAAGHGTGAAFRVRASYDAVATPDAACGGLRVVADGSATGTELGSGTWHDTECAAFTSTGIAIDGTLTLTAANGDELRVSYQAVSGFPDAGGAIHPAGTFTISGGTGRFASATGGGTIAADANVADPATTAVLDGTIDLR